MASSNCFRCLSRPNTQFLLTNSTTLTPSTIGRASFSSTSFLSAAPVKNAHQKAKGASTLRIKKKPPPKPTGKPPAQGERKAMRKRIVLSNTNALEVEGMKDMDSAMIDDIVREENASEDAVLEGALAMTDATGEDTSVIGKVAGLQGSTVDSLRAAEAFKITQGWGLFRRPGVLIREESVTLSRKMFKAYEKRETLRLVIDGERVTGKSLMLLHAMATAFVKGWIVLNIPEAQEVTNAVNDYAPIPGTKPTLYSQNTYTAAWLDKIGKANTEVLQGLKLSQKHNLPIPVQENITLGRLCELGARDPDVAWPIFQAFWSEITDLRRPPILMCMDSVSFALQNSLYRAPDFSLIHSHDLAIVRHFMDHLSGKMKLPNGGAIIVATNRSHAPISKSLNLAIKQTQDREAGRPLTPRDPFEKAYDTRADEVMKGVEVMSLKGLSKKEARGLMEYWAQSGVLRSKVDEETVTEKWALAGNGVVGEIQRAALWMRI